MGVLVALFSVAKFFASKVNERALAENGTIDHDPSTPSRLSDKQPAYERVVNA